MTGIITFLLGPIGRYLLIASVVIMAIGGIYVKGRSDGKASYQAALARQANKAIAKGNSAEAEALKKFDEQKDLPDDGFARD